MPLQYHEKATRVHVLRSELSFAEIAPCPLLKKYRESTFVLPDELRSLTTTITTYRETSDIITPSTPPNFFEMPKYMFCPPLSPHLSRSSSQLTSIHSSVGFSLRKSSTTICRRKLSNTQVTGDYCDVYLTHDSMSVRKAHNAGRNHERNVLDYYQRRRSRHIEQEICFRTHICFVIMSLSL